MKKNLLFVMLLGLLAGCGNAREDVVSVEAVSSHQEIIDAAKKIEKMRLEYRGGKDKVVLDNGSKDGVMTEYARADADWQRFYGLCVHDSLEEAYAFLDREDASKLLLGTFYMSLSHTDIIYGLLNRVVDPIVEEFCSDVDRSLALRVEYWKELVGLMEMTSMLNDGYVPETYHNAVWNLAALYMKSGMEKEAVACGDGLRMVMSHVLVPECGEFEADYFLAYDSDGNLGTFKKYYEACQNLLSDYGDVYAGLGLMDDYREAVRNLLE